MKRKLVLALFLLVGTLSFGQLQTLDTPDCQIGLDSDGSSGLLNSNDIDNRASVCTSWTLVYSSTGFSAVSIEFQSAPDSGGAPGAYVTWANVDSGSTLPLTSTNGGQVMGFRFQPHARIHINSTTGTGRIMARLLGYKPFKGATDPTNGSTNVNVTNTSVPVSGFVVTGTPAANSLGGMPSDCDTASSGTVTAGQAQMVRCSTAGVLATSVAVGTSNGESAGNVAGMNSSNGNALGLKVYPKIYNGTTLDHVMSASSANFPVSSTLTARNSVGAAMTERNSRWAVTSAPAAGVVGSASIALEAGVKHVASQVCFSAGATAAPVATSLQVNIRDGATGAGTILMTFEVDIPASAGNLQPPFCTGDLNLVGTAGTAMTAEWSSGLANLKESISITGFNVN